MGFTVTHTEDETKLVNIKIRFVAALQNKQDYGYFQLFNLLSRRGLENLQLRLFGRNYFDPKQKVYLDFLKKWYLHKIILKVSWLRMSNVYFAGRSSKLQT